VGWTGVLLAAAAEVGEGGDGAGEGVDLVGDGEAVPALDLLFEFLHFLLGVGVGLALRLGGLALEAVAAAQQRDLG
jgi:hypothetical protein